MSKTSVAVGVALVVSFPHPTSSFRFSSEAGAAASSSARSGDESGRFKRGSGEGMPVQNQKLGLLGRELASLARAHTILP